jgi:hypothetical protein
MTEPTDLPPPVLSPATQAAIGGLTQARISVEQQTKNLEQALADDVNADPPRLTTAEAAVIAKANDVKPPPPPGPKVEAKETTPAANQAQLDAQTKAAEAAEAEMTKVIATEQKKEAKATDPKGPPPPDERGRGNHQPARAG